MSKTSTPGVTPTGDPRRLSIVVAVVTLVTLGGVVADECAKQFLFPNVTMWQSHAMTVCTGTAIAALAAWLILRRRRSLLDRLAADQVARQLREEALSQSEEKYRVLVETTNTGFVVLDAGGRVLDANPEYVRLTGHDKLEEILGRGVVEWTAEHDRERNAREVQRCFEQGCVRNLEVDYRGQDGRTTPIEVNATVVQTAGGPNVVTLCRDITGRRRAEAEVKALQRQMEFILGATGTGLDIIDSDYNIRYVNEEWQAVYGDPAGRKCYEYFMGREHVCPGCGIRKALETKQLTVTEEILVREGNKPIQVTTMPFQNSEGEWLVAEVNVDITDRRRAEDALYASEEQLRITLASIGDGVVATDAERRVTQLNRVAETLTGWTSDEAKGKPFAEVFVLLNELTREPLQDPVEEAIVTGRAVRMVNHALLVARDGTERPVADSAAPIRDASGRIVGAVLVFRDVTEERRRRREKDQLLRDLGERVKELECLSGLGRLLHEPGLSLEDALDGAARLVPAAFQYPDTAAARICCDGRVSDAGEHPWDENATPLSADILARGQKVGWVGVCYPAAGAEAGERLFLKEEQTLLDAVAERLGRMIELKRAERALRESEERFRVVFESAADGILIADTKGERFGACNPAVCRMLGYSPEEILCLGVADIHPAEDLPRVLDEFGRQVRKEIALARELPVKRKDGSIFYADVCAFPIMLEGKEHLAGFFRDVTQRRQAEQKLRESEAKNRTLLENLPQRIFYKDTNSVYVSCNKHYAGDLKIQAEEIAGKTDYDFYPRELAEKYRRDDQWVVASGKATEVEEKYVQDGREAMIHTVKTPIRDAAGNVVGVLGIFSDITDRKKYEERLARLATHDSLTGLPNRRLFEEALARAVARARRGTPSAVLLFDVDHFKIVNDILGHAAGDAALVRVVNLVQEKIRTEDVLSRLGGDEFVVLLEGANLDYAHAVAERIRQAVEAMSFTSDSRVSVSLSIGLVGVGGQQETAAVLSQADAAMYQAKQSGRNHIAVGQAAPAAPAPCREHDAIS